ncbi:MAG: carotenoid oxygenase family protein [Congregibacter sp.]
MAFALTLSEGKAKTFHNKWIRTHPVSMKLGEAPIVPPMPSGLDCANTHILPFAGKLLAMTETSVPYALSPSMETLGRETFNGRISEGFTAHPHVDLASGRLHAIGYDVNSEHAATHFVIEPDGSLAWKTKIPLRGSSWIHDFAMTENYAVVWDLPLQYRQTFADAGEMAPYQWDPQYDARVGIRRLDDETADVKWFDTDPCWVFHAVNAWEELDANGNLARIVCNVIQFNKMFDEVRTGPGDPAPPQLYRWEICLSTGRLTKELVDERIQEYPRIDDRFWGKKSSFAVTTELFRFLGGSGLIVFDAKGGSSSFGFDAGVIASEGVFVPAGDSANEGEGWILAFTLHIESGDSALCVFDSTSIERGPIARVQLPHRVPFTFHGSWIPGLLR